jgi:hypothetical protein
VFGADVDAGSPDTRAAASEEKHDTPSSPTRALTPGRGLINRRNKQKCARPMKKQNQTIPLFRFSPICQDDEHGDLRSSHHQHPANGWFFFAVLLFLSHMSLLDFEIESIQAFSDRSKSPNTRPRTHAH